MLQREIIGATRERMLREIGEVLETITSENTLLLVFEDLHWADHSTVDLLSALARDGRPQVDGDRHLSTGGHRAFRSSPEGTQADLLVHQLCRECFGAAGEADITEYLTGEASETIPSEALAALLYRTRKAIRCYGCRAGAPGRTRL